MSTEQKDSGISYRSFIENVEDGTEVIDVVIKHGYSHREISRMEEEDFIEIKNQGTESSIEYTEKAYNLPDREWSETEAEIRDEWAESRYVLQQLEKRFDTESEEFAGEVCDIDKISDSQKDINEFIYNIRKTFPLNTGAEDERTPEKYLASGEKSRNSQTVITKHPDRSALDDDIVDYAVDFLEENGETDYFELAAEVAKRYAEEKRGFSLRFPDSTIKCLKRTGKVLQGMKEFEEVEYRKNSDSFLPASTKNID